MFVEVKLQGCPVFVQYNGVLRFREVWKVVSSCLSSGLMFGMCTTSLSKLVLAEMCVLFQNARFLLT